MAEEIVVYDFCTGAILIAVQVRTSLRSNNLKVGVERLSHITGFIQQWKYVCLNHMRRELPAGGKGNFERFG